MKEPRILVVEDDRGIASFIKRVLNDNGFHPELVRNSDRALEKIKTQPPDFLILDVELPGFSGLELLRIIRKTSNVANIPVLILSVLSGEKERVRGLQAGADDYLTKPFSPQELIERIRAILRRVQGGVAAEMILSAPGIRVDIERHRVEVSGKEVELRPKEYNLLIAFLKKPGKVLSLGFLTDSIWGDDVVVSRHTLSEHIKNLRKALGSRGSCIETVPDAGYRLQETP